MIQYATLEWYPEIDGVEIECIVQVRVREITQFGCAQEFEIEAIDWVDIANDNFYDYLDKAEALAKESHGELIKIFEDKIL